MSTATFVERDDATQGSWEGVYGEDGARVPSVATSPGVSDPSYLTSFTPTGASEFAWDNASTDPSALERPGGPNGYQTAWYAAVSFTLALNLTSACRIAVYCWDSDSNRTSTLEILDSDGTTVLDGPRTVDDFGGGAWFVWDVSGSVVIRSTGVIGSNNVVSGVFFSEGGGAPPSVTPNAAPLMFTF